LGRVECIAVDGLDLWFNSSDHDPPHFHVRKPDHWEIRVFFLTTTADSLHYNVKFQFGRRGPSARDKTALMELVIDHRDQLYTEWLAKVSR
jgi:hypothetical protein